MDTIISLNDFSGSSKEKEEKTKKKDEDSEDKVLQWKVRVHTTKMSNAGTDADVLITLCGEKGTSEQVQLDNKDNNFESGKVDEFTKTLANVGKPTKLRIGHTNSGMASGWHLEKVEMESVQTKKIYTFTCGRWLADDEDDGSIVRELPAEGQDISTKLKEVKYKVVVHTGSKFGAGTDAHVFINLIGEEGESGDRPLTKSKTNKNKFEKGNEDEFELDALGVGKLKKINIGHDGSNAGAGWYLDKVVITPATEKEIVFECDRWLDSDEDDKLIVRELIAK